MNIEELLSTLQNWSWGSQSSEGTEAFKLHQVVSGKMNKHRLTTTSSSCFSCPLLVFNPFESETIIVAFVHLFSCPHSTFLLTRPSPYSFPWVHSVTIISTGLSSPALNDCNVSQRCLTLLTIPNHRYQSLMRCVSFGCHNISKRTKVRFGRYSPDCGFL